MKKNYLLSFFALLLFSFTNAQIVNIPDANFKAKLLDAGPGNQIASNSMFGGWFKIDANDDGEIQVSEAQQVVVLNVSNSYISSMQGISSFTNLRKLHCSSNHISSLNITSCNNLEYLACYSNYLTSLDLSTLTNLNTLYCEQNLLSSLNVAGFSNLQKLDCANNNLTNLNLSGLTNLQELYCGVNQITSLDLSQSINLQKIYCNNNQLTSLNLNNLTNLTYLNCRVNPLPSINVSSLMNLQTLDCYNTQLTSLNLSGLSNLVSVDCSWSYITNLNAANCTSLNTLKCNKNQLTLLNLQNCTNLDYLDCSNNQLISLDLQTCTNIATALCTSNPFVTMFLKNGKNELLYFSSNPSLQYICCDESELSSIQNSLNYYGNTTCAVSTYCSFTPGGTFYTIQGQNKLDANNNGCDSNDGIFPNSKFLISNGTTTGSLISSTTGSYSIPVQAGTHTITPVFENPTYFTVSPTNASVSFPATASPYTQNFCIVPNGIHNDVEVTLVPITPARPGFSDAKYKLVYKNKGNQTISGSVEYLYDDAKMDFISSNQTVSSQTIGLLAWNYNNLLPFETRSILITMKINAPTDTPSVNGGDILNLQANINPVTGDDMPVDNVSNLNQTVVGSFDPNDKTCIEGNTITPAMVGNYVHYVIRFENTGTANAQNVVVKDLIDTDKFDISTLQITDTSHLCRTNISNGNKVEFIFESINLPYTEPGKHGYVAFKIKTKSNLVVGNTFSNNANIYFDYNLPVTTNTTITTVQNSLLLVENLSNTDSKFYIFPNPVKDILNIKTNEKIKYLEIFDMNGRLIQSIISPQKQVNVSELTKGTYVIKIISEKGSVTEKFIKQ